MKFNKSTGRNKSIGWISIPILIRVQGETIDQIVVQGGTFSQVNGDHGWVGMYSANFSYIFRTMFILLRRLSFTISYTVTAPPYWKDALGSIQYKLYNSILKNIYFVKEGFIYYIISYSTIFNNGKGVQGSIGLTLLLYSQQCVVCQGGCQLLNHLLYLVPCNTMICME